MRKLGLIVFAFAILGLWSCDKKKEDSKTKAFSYNDIEIPYFNADSAYLYVDTQCGFGPRVPESKAHRECLEYLVDFMKRNSDEVIVQEFDAKLYDGRPMKGKNIIASINPEANERILFGAHWDSRLWADHDPDPSNHKTPILGANDGASGIGVLMEIARAINESPLEGLGVDFVFFDLEDQGCPEWDETDITDQSDWCLGAQHWAKNPHKPFYKAKYGILLDMVGYSNPRFTKESQSMYYAASIMNNVWNIARDRGYSNIFIDQVTGGIMDDHIWINHYAKIPMINIVQNDPSTSFFPYWHTVKDDMNSISKHTLKMVGDICLTSIYSSL